MDKDTCLRNPRFSPIVFWSLITCSVWSTPGAPGEGSKYTRKLILEAAFYGAIGVLIFPFYPLIPENPLASYTGQSEFPPAPTSTPSQQQLALSEIPHVLIPYRTFQSFLSVFQQRGAFPVVVLPHTHSSIHSLPHTSP